MAQLSPTPDVLAKMVPVQNSCQVGDGCANLVSHSEAVLVAARREEGGGLMPRRPCDSFLFCRRPRASLCCLFVDAYGVHASRFVFVDTFFVDAHGVLGIMCWSCERGR